MPEFSFDEIIDRREVPALKWHKRVLGTGGGDLFPASVADMDFLVAPCIGKAIAGRARHGVFGYEAVPDGLIPALTGWLRTRHGWQADPRHILRAPNVLNALAMALNTFTDPGSGVIIQSPVFFDFGDIIKENGRIVVDAQLVMQQGRYEMDFDALEAAACAPSTQMMFLCNPHNPVGRVWSQQDLLRVGEICRRHGVLVVSDETHGDLAFPPHRYTPFASINPEDARNSVTCLSPAKAFNIAACCSAFTLVPDYNRRTVLDAANSRLTVNKNNAFTSVAMEAAYRDGGPWLDAVLRYLNGNLALIRSHLSGLHGVELIEPEGTFLAWLDFRRLGLDTEALAAFLRDSAGWAITRGIAFGDAGAGFGRLNFACPRSRLEHALETLHNALQ